MLSVIVLLFYPFICPCNVMSGWVEALTSCVHFTLFILSIQAKKVASIGDSNRNLIYDSFSARARHVKNTIKEDS